MSLKDLLAMDMRTRRTTLQMLELILHFTGSDFPGGFQCRIQLLQRVQQRSEQPLELFSASIEVILNVGRYRAAGKEGKKIIFWLEHVTQAQPIFAHPARQTSV